MKTRGGVLIIAAAVMLWLVTGCSRDQEASDVTGAPVTDEAALAELMLDDEVDGLDAWADDDGSGGNGSLDEPITPLRWRRLGIPQLINIQVEIVGDTLATITRTATFNGVIRILTEVSDTSYVFYDKPMYNRLVRKAHAVRVGYSPYPLQNWRITAVTPGVMTSSEPCPNTVWPVQLEVFRNTGEGLQLLLEVTDPLNTWLDRDSLPEVQPGEEIIVHVTANRLGPVGFFHPRVFKFGPHPRKALVDDGTYPDEVAGDGEYSGSYIVGETPALFLAAVDLLDYGTLFDSELPYDAAGWACRYRVITAD